MQAVCAKCSRLMCRAVVLFLVAECAQTTPMIAPLPGDPNFSIDGSVAFFKSGESNPTQPNPTPPIAPPKTPPPAPPPPPREAFGQQVFGGGVVGVQTRGVPPPRAVPLPRLYSTPTVPQRPCPASSTPLPCEGGSRFES